MTADEFIAAWELAFPRYVNAGVSSSGPGKPNKLLVEQLGQKIADLVAAGGGGDGTLAYATVAAMNADLAHDANTQAAVYADSGGDTTNHNGIWTKVGASGTGSWTWLRSLSIVELALRLDALEALNIDARLDAVEANSDTMAAYRREMTERPGDAPALFADAYTGSPDASTETELTPVTISAGKVLQLSGDGIIARRGWFRVDPTRKYLVRAVLSRATDPADPNNDAAELGIAWFKNDGTAVSATPKSVVGTFSALTVASGRTQKQAIIATASGDGITNVAPATTIYARPYVQTYGGGGLTNIEVVEVKDVTDAIGDSIATDLVNDAIAAAADVATIETSVQTLHDDTLAAAASAGADLWSRPVDSTVSSEPGSPSDGDRVLLDETNATHPNQVAERISGSWVYSGTPKDGQPIWDQNAKLIRRYSSAAGAWFASNNQSVLLSWFVTAGGAYDYASADSFADSAGLELEIDVPFDISGIGGSGVSFDSDISFGHAKITRGTKTVTFNGTVDKIRANAFDAAGTGLVTFVRTPRLYVCDLGVTGDGTTDDANALSQALLSAKASKSVLFGNNSIVCNVASQITIPPNIIFDADGLQLIPDATLTSNALAVVDGVQAGYTGELRGEINGLHLLQALTSNHADTSKNVDGLQLGSTNGAYNLKINDLRIEGFRDQLVITGPNAYILAFFNSKIGNGWRRNIAHLGGTTTGENINFHGGVIFNCNNKGTAGDGSNADGTALYISSTTTNKPDYSFHGTSFDYNDISIDMAQGNVSCFGCHFENNNNNPHVKMTKTSGKFSPRFEAYGGQITGGPGTTTWTGISTEDTDGRAALITTTGGDATIVISGVECGNFITTSSVGSPVALKTEIVKNTDGAANRFIDIRPVLSSLSTTTGGLPPTISNSLNEIYLAASGSATGWDQTNIGSGNTVAADTTAGKFQSPDTGGRKITCASGNSGSIFQTVNVAGKRRVIAKAWIATDTTFTSGEVDVRLQFYSSKGDLISDLTSARTVTATDAGPTEISQDAPIPSGAYTMKANIHWSGLPSGGIFWASNEHIWTW